MAIDTRRVFCTALADGKVLKVESFSDFLSSCDKIQLNRDPETTVSALANARGRWYEWLIGLGYWEFAAARQRVGYALIPLPDVRSFDASRIYEENISDFVDDLRLKVHKMSGVSLVTSNPDFVFIRLRENQVVTQWARNFGRVAVSHLEELDERYLEVVGKSEFGDVVGYLSAKVSLRPDRRLQVAHEGSLVKAIFRHIQTRLWDFTAPAPFYLLATLRFNIHDTEALNTVATHSLVTVDSLPEKAVDSVIAIDSGHELADLFEKMISYAESRQGSRAVRPPIDFVWSESSKLVSFNSKSNSPGERTRDRGGER